MIRVKFTCKSHIIQQVGWLWQQVYWNDTQYPMVHTKLSAND